MTAPTHDPLADVFTAAAVSDNTVAFNQRAATMMRGKPGIWDLGVSAARAGGFMPQAPRSPRSFDRDIDGVPVHVVSADSPRGIYLHIHGGALLLGSAAGQDPMLERIARTIGVTCVSIEYRLAPEHPYPAAWDDCETVAAWLAQHAKAEFGSDALLMGGESAGALLSVPTLIRLRDRHDFTGFRGVNLSCGVYDNGMTPSARAAREGLLKASDIARNADAYCPDKKLLQHPDVSPLYANLRKLPPALFTVGTLDGFLDDSMFMYCRWRSAGNRAELAIWPGADHVFMEMPIHPLAAAANARIDQFLSQCLA